MSANNTETPAHYAGDVTPWDLERCMQSSGNAFVDARRTDAIEYAFRIKDDLLSDLRKAIHCLQAAVEKLEEKQIMNAQIPSDSPKKLWSIIKDLEDPDFRNNENHNQATLDCIKIAVCGDDCNNCANSHK